MAWLFWELIVKANCACTTINPGGSFFFFLCICRHCPKVTNFVSFLAWDQYRESLAGEGGSYMIKWLTEQDIYWLIIYCPTSQSQVLTCCLFFHARVKLNHWATTFSTWWSVDGLMNHSFFSFSPLWWVYQFPNRNIGKTYILQLISSLYFTFCLHLFSPSWGEKMKR